MKHLALKTLVLSMVLCAHSCLAQYAGLFRPAMVVPDSLIGNYVGSIAFGAYYDESGKFIAWQLKFITIWDWKKHKFVDQYHTNPRRFLLDKKKGIYEPQIIVDLNFKNTAIGNKLAQKLTPWCEEYVKKAKKSPYSPPIGYDKNLDRKEALFFSMTAPFGAKKQMDKIEAYMKKHRPKQITPKNK